jgi:hypothetical protein
VATLSDPARPGGFVGYRDAAQEDRRGAARHRGGDQFSFLKFFFSQLIPLLLFVRLYLVVAVAIGTPLSMLLTARNFDSAWHGACDLAALGLWPRAPVVVAGSYVAAHLERRDASQDAPPVDPKMLREMARREDWIPQNHMGSLVLIKPGILRMILIRAGHRGLGSRAADRQARKRLSRLDAHDPFRALGDGQQQEPADVLLELRPDLGELSRRFHREGTCGLTLAWCCGVGFPPTRFLVKDGASHGRSSRNGRAIR